MVAKAIRSAAIRLKTMTKEQGRSRCSESGAGKVEEIQGFVAVTSAIYRDRAPRVLVNIIQMGYDSPTLVDPRLAVPSGAAVFLP